MVMEIRGTCGSDQKIYKQCNRDEQRVRTCLVDLHERRACAGPAAQWLGYRCIDLPVSACTVLSHHGKHLGAISTTCAGIMTAPISRLA
jgi:hypothetical protein